MMDKAVIAIFVTLLVYLCACFIFLIGFFQNEVQSISSSGEQNHTVEYVSVSLPVSCRTVFVVIDALRWDFLGRRAATPFLSQLADSGRGLLFTAQAMAPTVTLPRIKSLVSGSVPHYLDVLDNIGGPAVAPLSSTTDSWVAQAAEVAVTNGGGGGGGGGHRIVFCGDDSWLRLFPTAFVRHHTVNSWDVNDYTECDANVTASIRSELSRPAEWDVMIVHYLGLDRIGHLYGAQHPLIDLKLRQMDRAMQLIYESISTDQRHLLVVCGDHGMATTGSHGGSSQSESLTGLGFYSTLFETDAGAARAAVTPAPSSPPPLPPPLVQQVDIASTVAAVLGLPPPLHNVGRLLWSVAAPLLASRHLALAALLNNARQLQHLCRMRQCSSLADEVDESLTAAGRQLAGTASDSHDDNNNSSSGSSSSSDRDGEEAVLKQLLDAVLVRLHTALYQHPDVSGHSTPAVTVAVLLQATAVAYLLCPRLLSRVFACRASYSPRPVLLLLLLLVAPALVWLLVCHVTLLPDYGGAQWCGGGSAIYHWLLPAQVALVLLGLLCRLSVSPSLSLQWGSSSWWCRLLALFCCAHSLTLFSSSLVEEEHQLWYQLLTTGCLLLLASSCRCQLRQLLLLATRSRSHVLLSLAADQWLCGGATVGRSKQLLPLAVLTLCSAFLRRWNRAGDKWRHLPALRDTVFAPDATADSAAAAGGGPLGAVTVLACVVALWELTIRKYQNKAIVPANSSPLTHYWCMSRANLLWMVPLVASLSILMRVYCASAVAPLLLLVAPLLLVVAVLPSQLTDTWSWLGLLLLCRVPNMPAWLAFCVMCHTLSVWLCHSNNNSTTPAPPAAAAAAAAVPTTAAAPPPTAAAAAAAADCPALSIAAFFYCVGRAGFFYMGGSNSPSTVDVVTVPAVWPPASGVPILSALLLAQLMMAPVLATLTALKTATVCRCWPAVVHWLAVMHGACLLITMLVVLWFRHHLFVWSVFAPKLLYEFAYCLAFVAACVAHQLLQLTTAAGRNRWIPARW